MIPVVADNENLPIKLSPVRQLVLVFVLCLFVGTLFEYFRGSIEEAHAWLWPMLFVPLALYLLGIVYGDIPARYYDIKKLEPFPAPFGRQFDRCVAALIVLNTGLMLNVILLTLSLLLGASLLLIGFYSLYLVLMLTELPHSVRIFRYIQHVNTIQYVFDQKPNLFKTAIEYFELESKPNSSPWNVEHLDEVFSSIKQEAADLVLEKSALTRDQQIALNLAVRAGEAIRRCILSHNTGDLRRAQANLLVIESLKRNVGLSNLPSAILDIQKEMATQVYGQTATTPELPQKPAPLAE